MAGVRKFQITPHLMIVTLAKTNDVRIQTSFRCYFEVDVYDTLCITVQ